MEDKEAALVIERLVHRIWLHGHNITVSPGPLPVIILNMDRVWNGRVLGLEWVGTGYEWHTTLRQC